MNKKKSKFQKIYTNFRVIILALAMILALIALNPTFNSNGVAIQTVFEDGPAAGATPQPIQQPDPNQNLRSLEVITSIDETPIKNADEFNEILNQYSPNETIEVQTNQNTYFIELGATENNNQTIPDIGLNIRNKPTTNLRPGLDIAGGTRVLLEPETQISNENMTLLLDNLAQRLDVFGLGDVSVREASDLFGNSFILVEMGGVNEEEVVDLLSSQGVFEAKIGNETVFTGDNQDILNVDRSADRSGIEPGSCTEQTSGFHTCRFRFSIALSQEAAQRQADVTKDIDVINEFGGGRLAENLTLFLDGQQVNELTISASLRGTATRDIQISGSGEGQTQEQARENALVDMRQLQTVMETGSLPVELNIAKVDTISPAVGAEFASNSLRAGIVALLMVLIVISLRYRNYKIALPVGISLLAEVTLLLGLAASINWSIDMAAIAAIIIAVGSGVDHQIVIAEETLNRNKGKNYLSWKKRQAKAFFIIMASYFTLIVAMIPLWFAGAGLLRGFALTTIMGVTIGVLITRPAFAEMMKIIFNEKEDEEDE